MTEPQPNRAFEWAQAPWGVVLRCRPLARFAHHFFTTSNLSLRQDSREWELVAGEIGVQPAALRRVTQVHGADVAVVRRGQAPRDPVPQADGMVTDDPTAALAVRVADCAPILIADRRQPVVAAVHAGWRGTMKRAAQAGVHAMVSEFGSEPTDLVAAIGPCLGPCCGEVGSEVLDAFALAGHDDRSMSRWFVPGSNGRSYFNLWEANRDQLRAAGVPDESIHCAELCTKSYPEHLHSFRAVGPHAGRMIGVIRTGDGD